MHAKMPIASTEFVFFALFPFLKHLLLKHGCLLKLGSFHSCDFILFCLNYTSLNGFGYQVQFEFSLTIPDLPGLEKIM